MWDGVSTSLRTFYLAKKAGIRSLKPIQNEMFKFLFRERSNQPIYKRDFIASRLYANRLLLESGFTPFYKIDNTYENPSNSPILSDSNKSDPDIVDTNLGIVGIPGTGKTLGVLIALSEIINNEKTKNRLETRNDRPKMYIANDKRQESRFKRYMLSRTTRLMRDSTLLVPHTIILCPSRETCLSVYNQTQNFEIPSLIMAGGYGYKRRSSSIYFNTSSKKLFGENSDVVIGTPEMIVRLMCNKMQSYEIDLSSLKSLVIFESHILLDGKDLIKVNQIFEMFKNHLPVMPRVFLTTVAKTSAIIDFSQKNLQPMHWISDETRIGFRQSFIGLTGQDRLSRLLQQDFIGKLIVFCNTVKSCKFVYNVLSEKGIKAFLLHGEKSYRERTKGLYSFSLVKNGVLVTTDVFARGYKLGKIDGFISFDFPSNIASYLSRLGVLCKGNGWARIFFAKKHSGLIRQIAEMSERDLIEFHNSGPIFPVVRPRGVTIRTVNRHVTSLGKKLQLKKMYYKNKIMKHVMFLRKRKLLGKKQLMPRMPDRVVEDFDTQEIISMRRSKDGFVQIFPKRRSESYIIRRQNV